MRNEDRSGGGNASGQPRDTCAFALLFYSIDLRSKASKIETDKKREKRGRGGGNCEKVNLEIFGAQNWVLRRGQNMVLEIPFWLLFVSEVGGKYFRQIWEQGDPICKITTVFD